MSNDNNKIRDNGTITTLIMPMYLLRDKRTHTHIHSHRQKDTHTHTHTHIHIHTDTNTHTHTLKHTHSGLCLYKCIYDNHNTA